MRRDKTRQDKKRSKAAFTEGDAVGVAEGTVGGATVGETNGVKKLLMVVMKLNVTGPWLSLKTMLLVWPPPPEPSCGSDVSLRWWVWSC